MQKISAPAWFYGPNGEAEIFNDPSDVPAGWRDHPFKVDETAPAEKRAAAKRKPKPELLDL
jgi:hypothetical protein